MQVVCYGCNYTLLELGKALLLYAIIVILEKVYSFNFVQKIIGV